jgi:hypothetical protein
VLNDRPDRVLEVGVDRLSGLIVLLIERFGETVTRHAEVTDLTSTADERRRLRPPRAGDARRLY